MRIRLLLLFVTSICAGDLNLRIIHTNDLMLQLDEFGPDFTQCVAQPTTSLPDTTLTTSTASTLTRTASTMASDTSSVTTVTTDRSSVTQGVTETTTPPTDTSTIQSTLSFSDSSSLTDETIMSTPSLPESNTKTRRLHTGTNDCFGGLARIAKKIEELRADNQTYQNSIFIDAGGIFGSKYFPRLKSEAAIKVTEFLQPDILVPSYNDFKHGYVEALKFFAAAKEQKISVLACNIELQDENKEASSIFSPYKVFDYDGTKIGIIGFVTNETQELLPETAVVKDYMTSILEKIQELMKNETVQNFIVAGSATIDVAKKILKRYKEVRVLVSGGGDSYFMYNGNETGKPDESYPFVNKGSLGEQYGVQVPHRGKYVGNLMLKFTGAKDVTLDKKSNPILLDRSVEQDADALTYVEKRTEELEQELAETVGNIMYPISAKNCKITECSAGNAITDAVLQYMGRKPYGVDFETAVAFWRSELMEGNLEKGKLNTENLLSLYPLHPTIAYAKLKGTELKRLFEIIYGSNNSADYLQFSGAKVVYETAKPKGKRVKEVYILRTEEKEASYILLKDDEEVYVALDAITIGSDVFEEVFKGKRGYMQSYNGTNSWYCTSFDAGYQYLRPDATVSVVKEDKILFYTAPKSSPAPDYTGTVFLTIFITLLVEIVLYFAYIYLWPKLQRRRGSLASLLH